MPHHIVGVTLVGVTTLIHWNGTDTPDALRDLPAGDYVIERADDALSPEEEEGLIAALDSVRAGKGVTHAAATDALQARLRK